MTDGQRLFEVYRRAWGSTSGNVEPAPWDQIADEYRPMWEAIAAKFADARIDAMVGRFLGWKLPANFAPDAGISFKPYMPQQTPESHLWPVGTNLFTADQARAMFMHALGVAAPQAPCYFCNKCGYFGPVQVFHERPNGSGKCDYMAVPMKVVHDVSKEPQR